MEVLARASGGVSGTHGHLHDIYEGSVYFHHKKHADYIQYTPTEVKKKCTMLLLQIHSTKDTAS